MANAAHMPNPDSAELIVRTPRSTDVLGAALRGAYGERCDLPEDMLGALRRLDAAAPGAGRFSAPG